MTVETAFLHVFAITEKRYMALVPLGTKKWRYYCHFFRDLLYRTFCAQLETMMGCYFLWGEAYVHGVMHGEAMGAEKSWFVLRWRVSRAIAKEKREQPPKKFLHIYVYILLFSLVLSLLPSLRHVKTCFSRPQASFRTCPGIVARSRLPTGRLVILA